LIKFFRIKRNKWKQQTSSICKLLRCNDTRRIRWFFRFAKIWKVDTDRGSISVRNPNASSAEPPKVYTFDYVFSPQSKQLDIYNLVARPILDAVLEGYNGKKGLTYFRSSGQKFKWNFFKELYLLTVKLVLVRLLQWRVSEINLSYVVSYQTHLLMYLVI
jgi:hypothetical protein